MVIGLGGREHNRREARGTAKGLKPIKIGSRTKKVEKVSLFIKSFNSFKVPLYSAPLNHFPFPQPA